MTSYNRVVLAGHMTQDPELKETEGGIALAKFGLATNERYKNRDGEQVERTCFVDVDAWGRQADLCSRYLSKGSPVLLEGRLEFRRWQTEDGQSRSKHSVRVDRIAFLDSKPAENGNGQADAGEADNMPF